MRSKRLEGPQPQTYRLNVARLVKGIQRQRSSEFGHLWGRVPVIQHERPMGRKEAKWFNPHILICGSHSLITDYFIYLLRLQVSLDSW